MNIIKVNFKKEVVEKTPYQIEQDRIKEQLEVRLKRIREIMDELKEASNG